LAGHDGVLLPEETVSPILLHQLLYGKGQNDASLKAYLLPPILHQIASTPVAQPQSQSKYHSMVFLVQIKAEELQWLHVLRSSNVDNYGNSVHTDPPVSTSPSKNTVYPNDQTPSPVLDGQPMRYHGAPLLIVTTTDPSLVHNPSLDTRFVCLSPNILLQ
jgi:hypothetical protein